MKVQSIAKQKVTQKFDQEHKQTLKLRLTDKDHLTAARQSPPSEEERAGQSGNTQPVRHPGRGLCSLLLVSCPSFFHSQVTAKLKT